MRTYALLCGGNGEVRSALEALKREHPDWMITFVDGRRSRWFAMRVYQAPAAYVCIECFSLRALRARLMANDWEVTPKYPLQARE